ncbi:M3 family oligoendopeptidase [Enterococcus sp. ALS3]|uniref:M3 family oligoendopeptidase n=1 Tax=Enterococcus alishanensis TaxID=1303817 RepID=A0ABS6TD31_9ENTE|nr:M3 family oligoendopeptidase [Enterococcus alishanensis]MBV7390844.1 M3 family oligoendopeptidase [Enterococcus alishanensis]
MSFTFTYQRPDFTAYQASFSKQLDKFKHASEYIAAKNALKQLNHLRKNVTTMAKVAYIRHSIDTKDVFYLEENTYWDQQQPHVDQLHGHFFSALLTSPFLSDLKKEFPETLFLLAEDQKRLTGSKIVNLKQQENERISDYTQLIASAEIDFNGKICNLSDISAYFSDPDTAIRESAQTAYWQFFTENEEKFDQIFSELVNLRHQIAMKLGFDSYVTYGDIAMNRWGYTREDLKKFRQFILEKVVPLTTQLYQRQQTRLGVDTLYHYDLPLIFPEGNPKPQGNQSELIKKATEMYQGLSPETGAFFQKMKQQDLLDLASRSGKQSGGYCEFIDAIEMPFIFANFNGTSDDVDVLTHETGHAFQSYHSAWIEEPELVFPTSEAAEIHSMSMEFLTWPFMEKFFKEDQLKYRFAHLSSALQFLPYGALVDHFQEEVYEHPIWTAEERKVCWRKLEKQYCPEKNYHFSEGLDRGIYWYRQGHIFEVPFYYIDYTLAQVCAFQFWQRKIIEKDPKTWEDYLSICHVGGTQTFTEILQTGHLNSPFDEVAINQVIETVSTYLENISETDLK